MLETNLDQAPDDVKPAIGNICHESLEFKCLELTIGWGCGQYDCVEAVGSWIYKEMERFSLIISFLYCI